MEDIRMNFPLEKAYNVAGHTETQVINRLRLFAAITGVSIVELPDGYVNISAIDEAVNSLMKDDWKKVITEMFGLDGNDTKTLEEVAPILKVTPERVRQIEWKVIKILRTPQRLSLLNVEGKEEF